MVRSLIGKQLGNPFRSRACWRTSTSSSTCSRSGGSNVACFTSSSPDNNPWKVAIVGSGPSGCYTAKYLLHTSKQDESFHIDILDRLPTAYGLVRNGVAPDHPEVKNVQHDFDSMMMHTKSSSAGDDESSSSSSSTIQFYGNVHVGKDVSLEELRSMYDMVVLAYGCESDRVLNLPGSSSDNHLKGILSAREFVAWYNGHVDFEWVGPVVKEALSSSSSSSSGGNQNIVVLGHGNVALDCARILAKSRDELDPTDIATRALEILDPMDQEDNIERTISIVGRRGHIQGAFTIKELRELTKLPHADFVVRSDELEMGLSSEASQEELKGSRPRTRMDKLLMEAASKENNNTKTRRVNLRFLLNPARFEAAEGDPSKLARIVCERTQLVGDAGAQRAVGTGEEESIDAQLALVSIGYKGVAIAGTEPWFDEMEGILTNTHGKVDSAVDNLGALYTAGWLKRGPSGIIGTNIPDAKDTVASMLHDAASASPKPGTGQSSLKVLLEERSVPFVDWEAYQRVDSTEMSDEHKRNPEQPREKFTTKEELLQAAKVS